MNELRLNIEGRAPISYPEVLKAFGFSVVITVLLPHHHLDLSCVQRVHLSQLCHTVGSYHYTPLVHQSPTAHQLPVRGLIMDASSRSTTFLQGLFLAVCLGHHGPNSIGGTAVDGCQPRPVSLSRPLWVKGRMLPTHCQTGDDRRTGQSGEDKG